MKSLFSPRRICAGLFRPTAVTLLFLLLAASEAFGQWTVTRIRFYPAAGREALMVGGRFTGSIVGDTSDFQELAVITSAPAGGQWTEITLPANTTAYRWIKYEAPPRAYGAIAELEFYAGNTKLSGTSFGTDGTANATNYTKALDGDTATSFYATTADDQYVGIDLGASSQVADVSLSPTGTNFAAGTSQQITLNCATAGATIIYTTDGTSPSATNGTAVSPGAKVTLTTRTTISAYATKSGLADSNVKYATYTFGSSPGVGYKSFHTGNSLTDTINTIMAPLAQSAGHPHTYVRYTIPGAPTDYNWQTPGTGTYSYPYQLDLSDPPFDHISTQPFAGHGRSIANEAFFSARFFQRARYHYAADSTFANNAGTRVITASRNASNQPLARSPNVQPWLYVQWPGKRLSSDTWTRGTGALLPYNLWPGATLEEAIANHLYYTERVRDAVEAIHASANTTFNYTLQGTSTVVTDQVEILPGTKSVRIVPGGVALGRIKYLYESGQIPGVDPDRFIEQHFSDGLHLDKAGQYIIACVFYACMYGESPEGRVMSAGSNVPPAQAQIYQRVAWDVVENYPLAGVYAEGVTPCAPPTFSPAAVSLSDTTRVTFSSATPGAWFRYTTDGSTPSPTTGLLYISPLSVRPGMTLKVVAFKNGYAPSQVVTVTYPTAPGSRLLLYEPFSGPATTLANADDNNFAWGAPWRVTGNNPSYAISGGASLAYGNLVTSGSLLAGGSSSTYLGRLLNYNAGFGPFPSYAKAELIEPRGRELWISLLARKGSADDTVTAAYLTTNADTTNSLTSNAAVAIGYFGTASNTTSGGITTRYWSLRYLNNSGSSVTVKSNVPVVAGQTALLALRIRSGTPNAVDLFVNPATLGGAAPSTAAASGTTTNALSFRNVSFDSGGGGSGQTAFDELRVGENFAAVTPTPPEIAVSRAGAPIAQNATDTAPASTEQKSLTLAYTIANLGSTPLSLPSGASLSAPVNCSAAVLTPPATSVDGAASTSLSLAITPAAPGAWSVTVSVPNNDADESPATWTIAGNAATAYASWTATIPWNGNSSAPTADPDGDGLPNSLEFFHGLNPLVADAASATSIAQRQTGDGASLVYKFRRSRQLGSATYQVLGTSSLTGTWTALTGLVETVLPAESDANTEMVQVEVPYNTDRYFLRLRVNLP